MAHKRMFSKDITGSDAFREMPPSSQALYFHLGMDADDDGFLDNYKGLMRSMNASDDDLKILLSKRFLILFPSKVVVVKHWLINNTIRKDRYNETKHLEEKRALVVKENGSYTELSGGKPVGNQLATKRQPSIEEDRIGEDRREEKSITPAPSAVKDEVGELIKLFGGINPSYGELFKRKPQRSSAERLLKLQSLSWWSKFMSWYVSALEDRFCPKAMTPSQMEDKFAAIGVYGKSLKTKGKSIV